MSSSRPRIGVVGCGRIAAAHASEYRNTGKAEIAAVFDTNSAAAANFADKYGSNIAQSADELAASHNLDAVSICSPPAAHAENCWPFLNAKIPILCEKPIAADAKTAAALARAVDASGSMFMMAFCHRFHPAIIELKRLIEQGTLGEPLLFRNIFGGFCS